jgi:NADH-quinone oxidoreductase subunit J
MYGIFEIALIGSTVIFSILTVELEDLLHSAICLAAMCVSIAGLFWMLSAPYAAVFQLLVYTGAVMVLFIAAIMLTSR